jgi:AcrR family transcriptional regulator
VSRRAELPAERQVREVLAQMRAEAAAGGPAPSVLALARRLGLSNTTFWRHYRDIATEIRHSVHADTAPADGPAPRPGRSTELATENARLRLEHDRMAGQIEAALGHLRRLAIDNARLRRDLEEARGITSLGPVRAARQAR